MISNLISMSAAPRARDRVSGWRRRLAVVSLACLTLTVSSRAQSFLGEWSTDDIGRLAPTGVAVEVAGPDTYVYVADERFGRIIKYNAANGARIAAWGEVGDGPLQFNRPWGIALDPVTHDLYVAERGNNRVQRITNQGAFVMAWGQPGSGPGQFHNALGIAVDASGFVYVSDYGNHRIQKFRVQGTTAQHIATIGSDGTGPGQLSGPFGIAIDPAGALWVADALNHRLQKFDANGNFLASIGSMGTENGKFITPTWIAFDAQGNYYVAETNSNPSDRAAPDFTHQRIQKFSATGAHLMTWGGEGEYGGQFRVPLGLATANGVDMFVADYGNTRVQKFDLNGPPTPPPPPPPPPPTGPVTPNGPVTGGARFINLSSRLRTMDGDATRAFIAGFVVSGTTQKQMLIRAVGPALAGFGVPGALPNPKLRIFAGSQLLAENEDWANDPAVAAASARVGAFALPNGSLDAALLVTLLPGSYSAQVVANGGDGVALVEVYDVESAQPAAQLINLSTRGFVETDNGVLVAGFVVSGDQPKRVLIRGIGPALGQFGVGGTLADSVVKVFSGDTLVAQNDDWETPFALAGGLLPASAADVAAAAAATGAFPLPGGGKDAAVLLTLQPGAYSAVVSGANGTTGAGLVEVYELRN